MDGTYPTFQAVMDEAYNTWQSNPHMPYDGFLFELDGRHRTAVLIGNLNYQVENGGFLQWIYNDYGKHYQQLYSALDKIGTETAERVKWLVSKKVVPFMADDDPDFDEADTLFYETNEQLLADVEAYFKGAANE